MLYRDTSSFYVDFVIDCLSKGAYKRIWGDEHKPSSDETLKSITDEKWEVRDAISGFMLMFYSIQLSRGDVKNVPLTWGQARRLRKAYNQAIKAEKMKWKARQNMARYIGEPQITKL